MALPKAFATLGLVVGGCMLVLVYCLSSFSLQELVHVSQATRKWTYVELAKAEFGRAGVRALQVAIILNNAGSMVGGWVGRGWVGFGSVGNRWQLLPSELPVWGCSSVGAVGAASMCRSPAHTLSWRLPCARRPTGFCRRCAAAAAAAGRWSTL